MASQDGVVPGSPASGRDLSFVWRRPDWLPTTPGDGLVAALTRDAVTAWADLILAAGERGYVVWAAAGARLERAGHDALRRPGVRAVTLMPAGADPCHTGLGLRVAAHLAGQRAMRGGGYRPCVTSWTRPGLPMGLERVPHLVSVTDGRLADVVVWELTSPAEAAAWAGGPLPDLAFFETHLPGLCALRAAARAGRLPDTHAGQRLRGLLRHQDLTIGLVYQHPDLFRILLTQHALQGTSS